jgi:UDP-N-acetylmuramoylalanine--D-glutamate ligase
MSVEMTRPRLAQHQPSLENLEILVLGLGRSGLAAVRLARAKGASVTAADVRTEEELGDIARSARDLGARVRSGGHPAALAEKADLVVVSPGVPADVEVLRAAQRLQIPVWSEIELAARFCRGAVIAVTGSNGKSTVISMAGGILRGAGLPGGTGGNLAIPFADLLGEDSAEAIHALELSSFQLEAVDAFSPEVAAILNLSPDHLDRHSDYEAYARAKARLLQVQSRGSHAILNADDPESQRFHDSVRGRLHLFSTRGEVRSGAFLRQGRLILRLLGDEVDLMAAEELPVPGEHNIANALTAALACTLAGCPADAVAAGLRRYAALPHRLEHVLTLSGVAFYNDSKATNPASAARALCSFETGKVHLILGGKAKGASWEELALLVEQRAKQVLLVGEASGDLERILSGRVPFMQCGTIRRAVEAGYAGAESEEIVLLSPACASFDQYANFEERGEDFRAAARALQAAGGSDA